VAVLAAEKRRDLDILVDVDTKQWRRSGIMHKKKSSRLILIVVVLCVTHGTAEAGMRKAS